MQLRIPLGRSSESQQDIPATTSQTIPTLPPNDEPCMPTTNNVSVVEIPETENLEVLIPTIDQMPQDMVDSIITSLRADPDLHKLMDDVENGITYEDEDIDIDLEIASDLLEKELIAW